MKYTLILVAHLACLAAASPICSRVSIPVVASADNVVPANPPDANNATAIDQFLLSSLSSGQQVSGTKEISGTFTVAATYCQPPTGVKIRGTLQLLVHGISYNRSMWDGLGSSDMYNWHIYATTAGYHTLAVDRLGHGEDPQHPDPFSTVQGPLNVEILHQIVAQARAGTLSSIIPALRKVALVGHSYGSALGNLLSIKHPSDIDAYVLTGFSSTLVVPQVYVQDLFSAATISPRFANLPLGYLTGRTEAARTAGFYAGAFDNAIAHLDFEREDTVTVEEFLSPGLIPATSPYSGPVFLATGDHDVIYCNAGPSMCEGLLGKTKMDLFPSSSKFGVFVAKNTGHTLTLHLSIADTAAAVHDWLNGIFPFVLVPRRY